MARSIVRALLASGPSIRWKVRVGVLGGDPASRVVRRLQAQIRRSPRVRSLLDGHAAEQPGTYSKWLGAHWVLAALADLGHPPSDPELVPLRDRVLGTWLAARYFRDVQVAEGESGTPRSGVPVIRGRPRRCGSQQGSALLSVVRLGLEDERSVQLVERLVQWQWPDGGWNCDRGPEASCSSLYETLLPMRGLAAYARAHDDAVARAAAHRAGEVLLERRVLFHRSDGRLIDDEWTKLHYPLYWYCDVLGASRASSKPTGSATSAARTASTC